MDYELTAVYDESNNRWAIKASGEIDIFNSEKFKDRINGFIMEKPGDLHIDCGGLKYIDSTALGALVAIMKKVHSYDGQVSLVNVSSGIMRLLRITNLDKAFLIPERE